jgi:hypothetical protein
MSWNTELTKALADALCAAARATGAFKRHIALAHRVRPDMLEFWLTEGMRDDAPEELQDFSARFQATQSAVTLDLTKAVKDGALAGEWDEAQAAVVMLKLREPLWSGSSKVVEKETAPSELGLEGSYAALVGALKRPDAMMARALREAGLLAGEVEDD